MPCPKCLLLFHRFIHATYSTSYLQSDQSFCSFKSHTRYRHTLSNYSSSSLFWKAGSHLHPCNVNHQPYCKNLFFHLLQRLRKRDGVSYCLLTEKFFIKLPVSSQSLLGWGCEEPAGELSLMQELSHSQSGVQRELLHWLQMPAPQKTSELVARTESRNWRGFHTSLDRPLP